MKTICYFYNGHLCSTYKVKHEDDQLHLGNDLILQGLRTNKKMKDLINIMSGFVILFQDRRKNKQRVSSDDHEKFVACLLGLIKLKILHNDDNNGWFCGKYKINN